MLRALRLLCLALVVSSRGGQGARKRTQQQQQQQPSTHSGCPPVQTQPDFNLTTYISKRWYVQEQMEVAYQPADSLKCVSARYERKDGPDERGYTISVFNSEGQPGSGNGNLCAWIPNESEPAKIGVAQCFLPLPTDPGYWVVAYNEDEGYALISGGQPTIETPNGCRTGSGFSKSGLWIFAREVFPPEELVAKVKGIAIEAGYDISVFLPVNQTGCTGPGYPAGYDA